MNNISNGQKIENLEIYFTKASFYWNKFDNIDKPTKISIKNVKNMLNYIFLSIFTVLIAF